MQMTRVIEIIIEIVHYNENNTCKKTFLYIKCLVKFIQARIVGAEN